MKLLVTGDLHLRRGDKVGLEVLREAADVASCEDAVLILAGDVFDSPQDGETLMPEVEKMLGEFRNLRGLLVAGEHDEQFWRDASPPPGFSLLSDFEPLHIGNLSVCGHGPLRQGLSPFSARNIQTDLLVVHATIFLRDKPELFMEVANRKDEPLPVWGEEIARAGVSLVVLGHLHQTLWVGKVGDTTVVYPGSPRVVDDETGKRFFVWIEKENEEFKVAKRRVQSVEYRERVEVWMAPGTEWDDLTRLRRLLEAAADPMAHATLLIQGEVVMAEHEIDEIVEGIREEFEPRFASLKVEQKVGCWRRLVEELPVVREFVRMLADSGRPSIDRATAARLAFRAFMAARAR